ncbi:transcriptional regulator PpsR [Roseomonas sp. CCTCC AB2023176]|uniref:transcriptional regulator PpsR n=1 Tax=Roseomonas sp. CCTCC AB2023176 TaxID=3342640 RepID=UPI0035D60CE8
MKPFKSAARSLEGLDAKAVGLLLAAAADIVLILDRDGMVLDLAISNEALTEDLGGASGWAGRAWAETVALDSRPKVESLVREAKPAGVARWRQVNHPGQADASVPVLYGTVALPKSDRIVAIGRDQRAVAALHQRLVDAQQSMERDYVRLRHAESRYRLLFQMSAEGALILDAATHLVQEANPAAEALLGGGPLAGRSLLDAFDSAVGQRVATNLAEVRFAGRATEIQALTPSGDTLLLAAAPFRQDRAPLLLLRLRVADGVPAAAPPPPGLLRAAQSSPDALVSTDADGTILAANPAFLDLAQLEAESQAVGESLERWLGPGLEFEVLLATLRTRGSVHLFATTMRGEHGTNVEAEVSAAPLGDDGAGYGFCIRDVGARPAPKTSPGAHLARPVEQLTELVGRVPLKELVRETTDVIERLAIEAALQLTDDNRASAAEMLGLSRQSLYVKLRRYGLGGNEAE